jgi:RNA polymerase sigma-70 factor (ECF subfamily)
VDDARLRSLVAATAEGDQEAFGELYDATAGRSYAIALRITRRVEDAEEVVCDVYHQVWRQAARFDAARGSVLGWLATIARSRALDRLRRRDPAEVRTDPLEDARHAFDPGEDPESLVSGVQEGTRLHGALRELSDVQQRLLGLAYFQGLSHSEIAAHTSLPLGTVKTHIRRALQALGRALPGGEDVES